MHGKSTTFRVILRIIEQTKGEVLYNKEKITQDTLNHFGYLPEEGSLIPSYTVLEYLNKKVKDLSKGNRQKIQFIVSNLHEPDFLILDEPFSGLDPISVEELKKCILELKKQGKTIIFSSHRMDHVEELCDEIAILEKGKMIEKGSLKDIKKKYNNQTLNQIFISVVGDIEKGMQS